MKRDSIFIFVVLICTSGLIAGADAQWDCGVAKRIYDEAHCAQAIGSSLSRSDLDKSKKQFDKAIQLLEQLRSFPKECRLEDDATLTMYQNNLRKLIAQHQENPAPKLPPAFAIEADRPILEQAGCSVP
jgi:hypothetical protein